MPTKTINLRDLPEDLVRRAKAYAALRGMTLKDFVVRLISKAVEEEIPARWASGAYLGGKARSQKRQRRSRFSKKAGPTQ